MNARPKGQPVKVQTAAIAPGSSWLKKWTADDDVSTNPATAMQPDRVPWTIYDGELMFDWIKQVHAQGGGESLGVNWTLSKRGKALVDDGGHPG